MTKIPRLDLSAPPYAPQKRIAKRFHLWAASLVLVGMALAASWAVYLPIFLSPNENDHYDFALTLYSAGRPMRPTENVGGRDTHPDVDYLMTATHARQQRLDTNVGADANYGTAAYYRKLDAAAPKVARYAYHDVRIDPVPYISRTYPIGYYALAALAIALGDIVAHGSVVGMFFFARYLSVALLAPTLWFAWLALLEVGLGARRALLILAGIAFFPMNAALAGYVQPDNLSAALIAPLLYCALRLRRNPTGGWLPLVAGILFSALIATKRHYFAAVFIPVMMLLLVRLPFRSRPLGAWLTIALVTLPALLSFGVTRALMLPAPGGADVCHIANAYSLANAQGIPAKINYLIGGFFHALAQTFTDTNAYQSFWLDYTAYRTNTIVLGSPALTSLLQRALPFVSGIVALAFVMNIPRLRHTLRRVARRRSGLSAARIATSNVIINSYLCFFAMLLAFMTYAGGTFDIEGRYWFPFLPGIWLAASAVAPRILPRQLSRRVGSALLWALVCFGIVGSAYTYPSIHKRFYEPLPPVASKEHIYVKMAVHANGGDSTVERVVLRLDGSSSIPIRPVDRPSVVCGNEKTLLHTGFEAVLKTSKLAPGKHELAVFVRTPWSPSLIDSGTRVAFEVSR